MLIYGRMILSYKWEFIKCLREWIKKENFFFIGIQVVEVGVDFLVDFMIMDRVFINFFFQCFGRVVRYGSDMKVNIFVFEDVFCGLYLKDKVEKIVNLMKEYQIFLWVLDIYQVIVIEVYGKKLIFVKKNVNREFKRMFFKFMLDFIKRVFYVLSLIEWLIVSGILIMRGFLILFLVGGEVVLISFFKLVEFYYRGVVEIRGWKGNIWSLNDVYNVVKFVVFGKNVEVVFIGEYDWECGIL